MAQLVAVAGGGDFAQANAPFKDFTFVIRPEPEQPSHLCWGLDRRLFTLPATEEVREFAVRTLDQLAPEKNLRAILDARVSYDPRPLSERIAYELALREKLGTEPFPSAERLARPLEIEYPPRTNRINKMDYDNIGRAALLEAAAVDAWLEFLVPDYLTPQQAQVIVGNSALSNIEKPLELITARWLKAMGSDARFDAQPQVQMAMEFLVASGFKPKDVERIREVNAFNTGFEGILAGLHVTPDLNVLLTGTLDQKLNCLANDCVHGTQPSKPGEHPSLRQDLVRPDEKMYMISQRYPDGLFLTGPGVRIVDGQPVINGDEVEIIPEIRLDRPRPDGVIVIGPYGALKDLIASDTALTLSKLIRSSSRVRENPELLDGIEANDPYEFVLGIARRHLAKNGVI